MKFHLVSKNIHNNNTSLLRVSLGNEVHKACCCDEVCESVETDTNRFAAHTSGSESTAAFVTICGKLEIPPVGGEAGHRFIQFRKQILRIFFNCSPQDAAVGWRG
ncbi:MAG TPA: hypothetical protein VM709_11510 [Candidatus Sulfotelmatobacter sp.]|nr:hypothetical protein [Candidatus Sulfotelmatobacter sp.]